MSIDLQIFTIGHSSHPLDGFLDLLKQHGIAALADVRRYPTSRRHPHFSRGSLSASLEQEGIKYHWIEALGGNRKRSKDARLATSNLSSRTSPSGVFHSLSASPLA